MSALAKISNEELEVNLKKYVQQERLLLHVVLEHIKEVEVRQIYLARAYSSMYEYLVKEHGYSGSAAMRRLEAARLLSAVPQIAEKIKDGSVNLSKLNEMSRAIKEKERSTPEKISAAVKFELVHMISDLSTSDAQKTLAAALDIKVKEHTVQRVQKDESVRIELTLSKGQMEKMSRCKDLAAHILKQNNKEVCFASLIEVLADQFLSKNNLENSVATAAVLRRANRTLTPKTRAVILRRDDGCQFVDSKTGKICGSKFAIQVDHKTAQWAGGNHNHENLQAYCAAHNGYKYKQESFIRSC